MKTGTILPVILPAGERLAHAAMRERRAGTYRLRLERSHGWALLGAFVLCCGIAEAQSQPEAPSVPSASRCRRSRCCSSDEG